METSAVPVTRDGLGGKSDLDTKVLGNTVKDETGQPELITNCITMSVLHANSTQQQIQLTVNALARTDLVLPLSGHDLGIGTRDVDAGVEASHVVSLNDITAEDSASADTTVVGALGSGETVLGPAEWPAVNIEKGVLLLETEPEAFLGVSLHQESSVMAEVEGVGLAIRHPSLTHDEDVGLAAEGVVVDGNGAEVDIRVVARGLAC